MGQEIVAVAVPVAPPPTPAAAAAADGSAAGGGGGAINVAQPLATQPPMSLPPGFRFHPTDEELVKYYLKRKACGKPFRFQAVTEIDVYKSEPWELASSYSSLKTRDLQWYFFSPVGRKYGNGSRLNRATGQGYWKATGKARCVRHKTETIGMKKTLVFHSGRAPDGQRTNWVMHEYRLEDKELERAGVAQGAFVLCRIFQKSGIGPPNGDRFAPFLDEEWDDGAALYVPGVEPEDDMVNADEGRTGGIELEQDMNKVPCQGGLQIEPLSLGRNKRPRQDDLSSSHANDSEDSLLGFPVQSVKPKESQPANTVPFDSSNLEKSVPPGYLKFISKLENEHRDVFMEKETLKIELMRAQEVINNLQTRIDLLGKENHELKRLAPGP